MLLPEHATALGCNTLTHLAESAESGHAWLQTCGCVHLYLSEFWINMGFLFFSSSLSTFVTPHILDKNPLTPTNIWVLSSVEKGMNHRSFPGQMTLQASRFIIHRILFGNDSSLFWCNAVTWAEAREVTVKRFPDFNHYILIIHSLFYMFI